MNSAEAEGDSIDDAIARTLQILGVTRERVEIEIIANASRGLLGIGGRRARVRATLRPPLDDEAQAVADDRHVAAKERERPTASSAGVSSPAQRSPADAATLDRASAVLQQLVAHIGSAGHVEVEQDGDEARLVITGDESGILIGRRGQTLDALEYLVNRIVSREDDLSGRLVVDSQGYRLRRRKALTDLAARVADQARQRGQTVTLNPMSPRDRRTVHLALRDDPSLTTRSTGDGYFRRLLVIPNVGRRREPHP